MSDGGESPRHSTAWVMVQVLDQNDNRPVFLQQNYRVKVPERERRRKGDAVFRVSAFDPDEGSNAQLSYSIVDGNQEGKFSIDARTGVVFSRKALTAGNYAILTVSARMCPRHYCGFLGLQVASTVKLSQINKKKTTKLLFQAKYLTREKQNG